MDHKNPRITVLLSVYNGEEFISEAVESILAQTLSDFEFVIYDDGSTDNTREIVARFNDPRIEVRANPKNKGLVVNLADGVRCARGDFIARMDADDIAHPCRFEQQVQFLDENPGVDVLGTGVVFFSSAGETLGIQPTLHDDIALSLFFDFTMMHPTVMFRTAALKRSGLNYDPDFATSEDFDLWTRMIRTHQFHNLPLPLLRMREHTTKMTKTRREEFIKSADLIRARQLGELGLSSETPGAAIFFNAARSDLISSRTDFELLQELLCRIIKANKSVCLFSQPKLEIYAAAFFRATCRRALLRGSPSGAAFWQSKLRRYDELSARQYVGMGWRTLRAFV
jgi:glycosyltransferase involved in cell wall biosynthesis